MAIHTFYQADTKADLYAVIPPVGFGFILNGEFTKGDIPSMFYAYDDTSAAADNFPDVMQPTLQTGNGRYVRYNPNQLQSDWAQATTTALDYIKGKPAIPSTTRTTSALSLSLVGTGATGTLIDATKAATVRLTVSTSTTSTIGGPATSVVLLKICATNNATEGSWTTVATLESDQTITLAIVLQSNQIVKGQLCADVPAGWFVKLVNSGTGTHAETFLSGQQTIYG